jgi:signal transduction histidine kinase
MTSNPSASGTSQASSRTKKLLPAIGIIFLASIGMLAQSLRSQLATDREIIAGQLTRQLLQVAEGLSIYAEFSGEALKQESTSQIQSGLNRLIFGQPGALRLAVAKRSGELIVNSFSSKGEYLGETSALPTCLSPHRPALADLKKYGELTVRICSETTLLIERLVERDDRVLGSLQAYVDLKEIAKETLRTAGLRHVPTIRLNAAESSSELACRPGQDSRALCLIETGPLGWIDALPDALITLVLILLVTLLALLLLRRLVIIPFTTVFAVLERVSTNTPIPGANIEVGGLLSKLQVPLRNLNEMAALNIRLREESAATRVRSEVAQQVAHDIRSPLAALRSVDPELRSLPENTRALLRNAIQRISDIANQLQATEQRPSKVESREPQLVSVLLEELMSEKRAQYRSHLGRVELLTRVQPEASVHFAAIDAGEFQRVISNLVNNSMESIGSSGSVRVELTLASEEKLRLEIRDTGRGIPEEILTRLGERGMTTKPEGQGLGIAHAITTIREGGGRIHFERLPEGGTRVTLELPIAPPPSWFPGWLELRDGEGRLSIIAIDDDRSIHSIWESRLRSPTRELLHCSGPQELEALLRKRPELRENGLFLMDQEFAGESETGLKLIEKYRLERHALLITSRYEDPAVIEDCQRLGVKLLPKGLAGFIPIRAPETSGFIVLLDDDPIVRMTWELSAKGVRRKVRVFETFESLAAELPKIPLETPIYLDQDLGEGRSGITAGDQLHERGYRSLHIATGSDESQVPKRPWIRSVRGKTPPWESA